MIAVFHLVRHEDVNGRSGTGVVAQGVVWDDGRVALHWLGATPTTVVHDDLQSVESIHGHEGRTVIEFISVDVPDKAHVSLIRKEPSEPQFFGMAGHCYDIDGDWWHPPGECSEPGHMAGGGTHPCCGVVKP